MNNSFIGKQKIRKYFYAGSILSIIILVTILSLNYIRNLDIEYSKKIEQLSEAIIKEKKIFMQNSIEQVICLIGTGRKTFFTKKRLSAIAKNKKSGEHLFIYLEICYNIQRVLTKLSVCYRA